jgi:hypothetical protein
VIAQLVPSFQQGSSIAGMALLASRQGVVRITAAPRVASRVQRVRAVATRAVPEVTDSSFAEDVLKSSTPVLVDFWAPCELEWRDAYEACAAQKSLVCFDDRHSLDGWFHLGL